MLAVQLEGSHLRRHKCQKVHQKEKEREELTLFSWSKTKYPVEMG